MIKLNYNNNCKMKPPKINFKHSKKGVRITKIIIKNNNILRKLKAVNISLAEILVLPSREKDNNTVIPKRIITELTIMVAFYPR